MPPTTAVPSMMSRSFKLKTESPFHMRATLYSMSTNMARTPRGHGNKQSTTTGAFCRTVALRTTTDPDGRTQADLWPFGPEGTALQSGG